jgi:corynomycolyl transferase
VLEQGTHQCTVALDQAMRKAGMTHQTVEYKHGGVHSWDLFDRQLPTAWQAIKPSLM